MPCVIDPFWNIFKPYIGDNNKKEWTWLIFFTIKTNFFLLYNNIYYIFLNFFKKYILETNFTLFLINFNMINTLNNFKNIYFFFFCFSILTTTIINIFDWDEFFKKKKTETELNLEKVKRAKYSLIYFSDIITTIISIITSVVGSIAKCLQNILSNILERKKKFFLNEELEEEEEDTEEKLIFFNSPKIRNLIKNLLSILEIISIKLFEQILFEKNLFNKKKILKNKFKYFIFIINKIKSLKIFNKNFYKIFKYINFIVSIYKLRKFFINLIIYYFIKLLILFLYLIKPLIKIITYCFYFIYNIIFFIINLIYEFFFNYLVTFYYDIFNAIIFIDDNWIEFLCFIFLPYAQLLEIKELRLWRILIELFIEYNDLIVKMAWNFYFMFMFTFYFLKILKHFFIFLNYIFYLIKNFILNIKTIIFKIIKFIFNYFKKINIKKTYIFFYFNKFIIFKNYSFNFLKKKIKTFFFFIYILNQNKKFTLKHNFLFLFSKYYSFTKTIFPKFSKWNKNKNIYYSKRFLNSNLDGKLKNYYKDDHKKHK